MDVSAVPLLSYRWSPRSDSDLSSLSSPETLSPLGSQDSGFSPSSSSDPQPAHRHSSLDPARRTPASAAAALLRGSGPHSSSSCSSRGRRGRVRSSRGRVRSKQRESASEKEKLRMRDLTKALHHLRSFLPASVAPAGQTLTKIETLRLAIRYIAHLSAQLGPAHQEAPPEGHGHQEAPLEGPSSPDPLGYFRSLCSSAVGPWIDPARLPGQAATAVHPGSCSHRYSEGGPYGGQGGAGPQGAFGGPDTVTGLLSPRATHHAHRQMFGPLVPRETQSSSSPAKTTSSSTSSSSSSSSTSSTRRSWSKFPGRKRQTASEREKLRMRDLTKSLNHVRSFLPASVAPAGQTLTKIETLRLTIRYIAHLSAQLGPAHQEALLGHGHQEAPLDHAQEVQTGGSPQAAQQNHQAFPERPHVDHLQHHSHIAVRTVEPEPPEPQRAAEPPAPRLPVFCPSGFWLGGPLVPRRAVLDLPTRWKSGSSASLPTSCWNRSSWEEK
ncbi:hypothetical protein CRUP_016775 [Coryphaenoides rupestris]|nr:hypothetical protein CRUP_016775 [Coryphaenoides rupestris]